MTKSSILIPLTCLALLMSSCNNTTKESSKANGRLSFDSIIGIKYYEIKRRFSTGLSFNELGFQQEPTWIIQFKSQDSIMAYSPQKKRMQSFFLHYDHGDVYNFAKEWFKIKKISKDSMVFQRLHLTGREISKDISSDVNMTWYSENYINNVLKTTAEALQRPTKADTAYIQNLAEKSNRNPDNRDSAFAGREPVMFIPLSKMIQVKKISTVDKLLGRTESYDYLFPSYRIDITKAYANFGYEFSALVDAKGKIHLGKFRVDFPENYEPRKKTLEAIINVYLQNLLKVIPGKTLGFPHSSEINLIVTGRKNSA
ncbi:MAG: hypothetical protein P0Y49_21320 [Candidatus Pedobacter colombiensis]|uniref:Uncharacterized protein n=1 Tax=Candidatus Pedobacter colombiensis TaxID=3121371 RepID=A0AAJ5W960_9SPHI|nr:hypothetical protein [Pedobacter sp.]WEK19319.1 MAG: hypothetical protein P0Y49_21320 [Pedobacter sp.]